MKHFGISLQWYHLKLSTRILSGPGFTAQTVVYKFLSYVSIGLAALLSRFVISRKHNAKNSNTPMIKILEGNEHELHFCNSLNSRVILSESVFQNKNETLQSCSQSFSVFRYNVKPFFQMKKQEKLWEQDWLLDLRKLKKIH